MINSLTIYLTYDKQHPKLMNFFKKSCCCCIACCCPDLKANPMVSSSMHSESFRTVSVNTGVRDVNTPPYSFVPSGTGNLSSPNASSNPSNFHDVELEKSGGSRSVLPHIEMMAQQIVGGTHLKVHTNPSTPTGSN